MVKGIDNLSYFVYGHPGYAEVVVCVKIVLVFNRIFNRICLGFVSQAAVHHRFVHCEPWNSRRNPTLSVASTSLYRCYVTGADAEVPIAPPHRH